MIWIIFISGVLNLFLGFSVWWKDKTKKLNYLFGIFALNASLLCFFDFLFRFKPDVYIVKLTFALAVLLPGLGLLWVCELIGKKTLCFRKFLLLLPSIIFFILALFTDLVIRKIQFLTILGYKGEVGALFPYYSIYIFSFSLFVVCLLYWQSRKATSLKKFQLRYTLMGLIFYSISGSFFSLLLPSFFNIYSFTLLDAPSSLFFIGFSAYAITRYQLMDIRVVIRQSTVIASTLLSIIVMFLGVIALCNYLVDLNINYALITIITFIFIITVSLFVPIKTFFERISNKYFFAALYNEEQILQSLIKEIPSVLDIKHLVNLIVDKTRKSLQIEKIGLLSTNLKDKKFVSLKLISYKEDKLFILAKNRILINYFVSSNVPVILQTLKESIRRESNIKYKNKFLDIMKEMEENKIEIILPLISKKKLIGLLFLGNKIDNALYSSQDIDILKTIANQSAAALENALLYKETKNFNITMREEVKSATKKLREANKELKKLDKVKSEFISIASHQLRTPITIIKGYISMILEGDYGKVNEKANNTLKQTYKSAEHMAKLVENFLNISRIESGKITFDFKKEKFDIIAKETVESFGEIAKTKNLKINLNIQNNLPAILVDKVKIKEVVSNLIDNAIKYTQQGAVSVSLKSIKDENKKFLLLSVADNGIGISKDDISNIFKKFIRGKKVSLVHTEGLGLGLYFSKKVVEAHRGKIWVESKGENKGSVFYVRLKA